MAFVLAPSTSNLSTAGYGFTGLHQHLLVITMLLESTFQQHAAVQHESELRSLSLM
jgi:hypothetical protein